MFRMAYLLDLRAKSPVQNAVWIGAWIGVSQANVPAHPASPFSAHSMPIYAGANDYQQAMVGWGYLDKPYYCASESVTTGQLVKVVTKHLNEHPEDLHAVAGSEVAIALSGPFPCR